MSSPPPTAHQKAAHLIALLNDKGRGDYIGEPISQLAHALQAAAQARSAGADDETVVAALLHDIGQYLPPDEVRALAHEVQTMSSSHDDGSSEGVGRVGHERIGAAYLLKYGFSAKVAALVESHVAAKRYLCATEPGYQAALSAASQTSLRFQGGPMGGVDLERWAANPWCAEMCRLRKWDDGAKVVGLEVPPAEAYQGIMERLLARAAP